MLAAEEVVARLRLPVENVALELVPERRVDEPGWEGDLEVVEVELDA